MVQILNGQVVREDITSTAMGGTEIIAHQMVEKLDPELLKQFQIVHSRVRDLVLPKERRIFVAHDLPGDPESEFLKAGGWNRFAKLVFVSNWQMQRYIDYYGIPWNKCVVIQNAIDPLAKRAGPMADGTVKLVYHTTPHRGLDVLANAFSNISIKDPKVTLDVYSSFKMYGWAERDAQYADVFDYLRNAENVTYHGSIPHDQMVAELPQYDIFAYPSLWPETSCISLMEAMSAGLLCVHSNYAALAETAANFTWMYQYQDDKRDHVRTFYSNLKTAIETIRTGQLEDTLQAQASYADRFYGWEGRTYQWNAFLQGML